MTGTTRARTLVVAALCRDDEGRILLSQRRPDQPMPNLWELPGGKIEPGEPPTAALEREIAEELACGVEVGPIAEVIFHAYPEFDLYMLVYACRILGTPRAQQVAAIVWATPVELPCYPVLPADEELVARLAASPLPTTSLGKGEERCQGGARRG